MPEPIKIELKSIRVDTRASEETYAYSAKLYADGVHVADVANEGRGGADRILSLGRRTTQADLSEVERRVTAEHPKSNLAQPGEDAIMVDETLEGLCHSLVSDHLALKLMRSDLKRNVVFYHDGIPAEGSRAPLHSLRINDAKGHTLDKLRTHVLSKHPRAAILNGLPEDKALAAFARME